MREIQYYDKLDQTHRDDATMLIEEAHKMCGTYPLYTIEIPVLSLVVPNWACAWNETKAVHREARVLATDGQLSLVAFQQYEGLKMPCNVYRNEDLTIVLTREQHAEASKLATSLGLPTYKYPEP